MGKEVTRVGVSALRELVVDALERAGEPRETGAHAANILVEADMMGITTHGVLRLEGYIDRIRMGAIKAGAAITVEQTAPSLALVEGADGLGPVVGSLGLHKAIEMAKETGIAYVGCRHSNHFGALAPYALQACDNGLAFIGGTSASTTICPWGGREARIGNNPFSVAAPKRDGDHFILDMAMSVAARGKIRAARDAGTSIPEGWAIDSAGKATTDPLAALGGFLLPVGGHKGSGLSMAIDIMSSVLTNGRFLSDVASWVDNPEIPSGVGHFFILIDPARLIGQDAYYAAMDRFSDIVRSTPPADESAPVILPGTFEQARRKLALDQGVDIPVDIMSTLRELAAG